MGTSKVTKVARRILTSMLDEEFFDHYGMCSDALDILREKGLAEFGDTQVRSVFGHRITDAGREWLRANP